MYANSSPFSASPAARGFAGAYRQVEVQTGVNVASPHKLVGMLFDGLLDAIDQARGALTAGNIELKAKSLGRATRIVDEGLKAALNVEQGGTLAGDLDALYAYVTLRLTHANLKNDEAALDECRNLIAPLRDAWSEIGDRV